MRRIEVLGVRFVTFSCVHRQARLASDEAKRTLLFELDRLVDEHRLQLHAWVAMPNHVHLLLTPTPPPASPVLRDLKRRTAVRLGAGPLWQRGGGYDRIIHSAIEYEEKLKYIHENPLRKGLLDYRWSSALFYDGLDYDGPAITALPTWSAVGFPT